MMDAGPTKHKFHTHQRAAAAVIDVAMRATLATRQPSMPRGPYVSNAATVSSKAIEAAAHASIDVARSRHTIMAAPNPTTAHAARDATRKTRSTSLPSSLRRVRIHADVAAAIPHSAIGVDAATTVDWASFTDDAANVVATVVILVVFVSMIIAARQKARCFVFFFF